MEEKPYHHGNLEIALIEAGLAIVDKEGLESMSLRRVAAACGVSHAAPYKHFKNKEELLNAMQKYVEKHFATVLEKSVEDANAPHAMLDMAKAYLRFFMENPHYFSFFQKQQNGYEVDLNDLGGTSNYMPFEIFKQAALIHVNKLELPEEYTRQVVVAMWAMVHGYTAIAVMDGVYYAGDWEKQLESILMGNMGAGGKECGDEK